MKIQLYVLLIGLFLGVPALAQVDPTKDWKRLRTEHFDIFFAEDQSGTGWRYGVFAEESYQLLDSYFTDLPKRTAVVIDDGFDLANGSATRVPYPLIMVYPVLPSPLTSISEYGSWGRELFIHEYTHIASFEATRGLVTPLRWLFGAVVTPNMLLPRWWLEGVAVEMETRLSSHGRLRSDYQQATLRALARDNRLGQYSFAEVNETGIPTWPGGARPYLFGSLMWSELTGVHGEKIIDQLHQSYGGRIPYLLNPPLRRYAGHSYPSLFGKTMDSTEARLKKQLEAVEEPTKLEAPQFLADLYKETLDYQTQKPAISPDGKKMVLIAQKRHGRFHLIHLERKNAESPFRVVGAREFDSPEPGSETTEDAPTGLSISRISWFPDSKSYAFDQVQSTTRFVYRSDLFRYDWDKKKSKRLSKGLRGREPSPSPDSKRLVYVQIQADYTKLALFDLKEKKAEVLYQPPANVRISQPSFLGEEDIVFSERNLSGNEHIKVFNLKTGLITSLVPDHSQARYPVVSTEGLLFSSTKNGISNLYLLSEYEDPVPVTHTDTGIFAGEIDPLTSDIYVTAMSAKGLKVAKLSPPQRVQNLVELPKVPPLYEDRYPTSPDIEAPSVSTKDWTVSDYSVGSYILPHYWLPFIFQDETGALGVSIETGGRDPLSHHMYSLGLALDPQTHRLNHRVSYTNATSPTLTHISLLTEHQQILGTNIVLVDNLGAILFDHQIKAFNKDLNLVWGWQYINRAPLGQTWARTGPTAGISYSDLSQERGETVPNSGWASQLSYTYYLPDAGDLSYQNLSWSGAVFHSALLPERHSFSAQLLTSYTDRDIPVALSTPSRGIDLRRGSVHSQLLMRGYESYQFVGYRFANAHLEYYFPIADIYRGRGTLPFFLNQVHGNLFVDALTMTGRGYSYEAQRYQNTELGDIITSVGMEANFDATVGYNMPISLVLGLYYGLTEPYGAGPRAFFGLQL